MDYNSTLPQGSGRFRPPSVEQALQYSPLCSIVPFSPDAIPYPFTGTSSSTSVFMNDEDYQAARRTLEALNAEANSAHNSSVRLQRTISDIKAYLNGDQITQFAFRPLNNLEPLRAQRPSTVNGAVKTSSPVPRLSQFAKTILNSTNISYQHPSSNTRSPKQDASDQHKHARPHKAQNQTSSNQYSSSSYISNDNPHLYASTKQLATNLSPNGDSASQAGSQSAFSGSQISQPSHRFQIANGQASAGLAPDTIGMSAARTVSAVVIPAFPGPSQRSEYHAFPDLDARIVSEDASISKKRKHEDLDGPAPLPLVRTDQRVQAEAAVERLQELINFVVDHEDESGQAISHSDLSRLDRAVESVNSLNILVALPADDLLRIQSICSKSIIPILHLQLSPSEGWSIAEVDEWLAELSKAQEGMLAARVALKIMIGVPEQKQLASEELIQLIIDAVRHIVDKVLLPVVKARSGDGIFTIASAQKKALLDVLSACRKVLRLLGNLVAKINITVQAQESMSGLANELLFAENVASEKESILGTNHFESARREAMEVVAIMLTQYPERAESACREALTAMKDLPVQPHRARQYRVRDGVSIQLITALLMRIIQTTATRRPGPIAMDAGILENSDEENSESEEGDNAGETPPRVNSIESRYKALGKISQPLFRSASSIAFQVMKHMFDRATTASKTGESPFQRLLELFVEDLVAVLGSPEWPAADFLLTALFNILKSIAAKQEDESVQARGMVLDFMGLMGTGIHGLKKAADKAARKLDKDESPLNMRLLHLTEQVLDPKVDDIELFEFDGPYRVILEYLLKNGDQLQTTSAIGFRVTEWANAVANALDRLGGNDEHDSHKLILVASKLRHIIISPKWLHDNYESNTVELNQAQLASMLITLEKTFCKSLHIILHHLLSSFSSPSITLRSRALKSLLLLLKDDPSLLERPYIIKHIRRLLDDPSARVRESALRAFAEVLSTSSELDKEMYDLIITRANEDPSTGVQTAAMKILKDIYKRHDGDLAIQSSIANAFLKKVSHPEKKSIAEPAIQSLEELWFLPLYVASVNEERDPKSKQQLSSLAKLMVQTVKRNPKDTTEFDILLKSLLSKQTSKNAAGNSIVSAHLVSVLYEEMISSSNAQDSEFRRFALETLAVFARADPSMFTTDRLEIMQPYLENLSTEDDLAIYQSVLVIYRHVFPKTKLLQTPFLEKVKAILMKRVSKLSKRPSLMETALCLQIIAEKLNNSSFLVTLSISALKLLRQLTKDTDHIEENRVKLKRVNFVLGAVGHASKLDHKAKEFQNEFPQWKGTEVAGLFVDFLAPLTGEPYPDEIEEAALGSICQICQAWPKQFMRKDVQQAIDRVFVNDNRNMEGIVLTAFRDFYLVEEKKSETGALIAVGEGARTGAKRLNVSLNPDENDGASPGIAQKFLPYFTRLALASTDGLAITATEVLASISRQGLLHPKECGVAFIALETSPNLNISTLAFKEHKKIHEKHETLIEMEYTKAIPRVFKYQRDVVQDHRGATSQPLVPKLHKLFEILKDGTVKVRKKFFANMVKELSFDFDKLPSNRDAFPQLLFTQFVVENLAFYEPPRLEELWKLVTDMEKVVIAAGSRVLETINNEVLQATTAEDMTTTQLSDSYVAETNYFNSASSGAIAFDQGDGNPMFEARAVQTPLTDSRLRQITIAAARLTIIWETRSFIRRLWGLAKYGKTGPSKDVATRSPTKAQGVSGDKYMDLVSQIVSCLSGGSDAMVGQCKASAELLSTDYEFKSLGSDDDGVMGNGYETPQEDSLSTPSGRRGSATPGSGKGRKRKLSSGGRNDTSSVAGTPLKKKGRPLGATGKPKKMRHNAERSGSANSFDDEDGDWD